MAAAHLLLMIGIYCRYEVAALTNQYEVAGRQPIGERHVASVTQSVRGVSADMSVRGCRRGRARTNQMMTRVQMTNQACVSTRSECVSTRLLRVSPRYQYKVLEAVAGQLGVDTWHNDWLRMIGMSCLLEE